jgi:hypothetical protein
MVLMIENHYIMLHLHSYEHVPVSVSIFSNVPEYDDKPIFICDSNPKKLIKYFVRTILKIPLKAKSINENKYNNIIEF